MTVLAALILAVALVVAAVVLAGVDRALRSRTHKRVIVTLKSGEAFRGVLWSQDRRSLVLRNAEVVEQGTDRIPSAVDGEILILRPDVAYMQFV